MRHFWYADLAQIYPTLHRLERDGLVRSRTEPSDRGPPRRIYRRTAAGRRELQAWLLQGPMTGTDRFPYLAQTLFLGDEVEPCARVRFLESLAGFFEHKVQTLKAIDADWRGDRDPALFCDGELFAWMTLDLGISRNEAALQWCRRSLVLARRAAGEETPPSGDGDAAP